MTQHDAVNHPAHYTQHPSGVECIAVTEHMNFCLGNAVKYIWRSGDKGNAVEDLRKARWYLDREIGRLLSGEPAAEDVETDGVVSAVVCGGDHTPGPWTVGPYDDSLPDTITIMADNGSGPRSICDIVGDRPVDLANAGLIAAAPKMLRALRGVIATAIDMPDGSNLSFPSYTWDLVKEAFTEATKV